MAALKYWVWLTTLPGLTDSSKMLLIEHFSSPEDIYYADEEALWQVDGLKKEQAALLGQLIAQLFGTFDAVGRAGSRQRGHHPADAGRL